MYGDRQHLEFLSQLEEKAKNYEMYKQYNDAILVYNEILAKERLDLDILEGKIRVLIKNENYVEATKTFDEMFLIYDEVIKQLDSMQDKTATNVVTELYIATLKGEAKTLSLIEDETMELKIYKKILDLVRFNIDGLVDITQVYEKMKLYHRAIDIYSMILNLDAEYPEDIQSKITELRSKL